jgi:hypothetical protein
VVTLGRCLLQGWTAPGGDCGFGDRAR